MNKTNIDYLDYSWNPTHGCSPISDGCRSCWANIMAKRLAGMGARGYSKEDPFKPTFCPWELDKPLRIKKPATIGVSFMGDLFHEDILDHQINSIFLKMINIDWHTYLVLTKRPERMADFVSIGTGWRGKMPNVWLGVSCENQARADERIPILLQIPAAKRFVSLEPLLGPVDLPGKHGSGYLEHYKDNETLDWVIVGGESGPGARPMHPDWVRSIRDQCQEAGVPFFFKQWGEWIDATHMETIRSHLGIRADEMMLEMLCMRRIGKKQAGHLLDGQIWDQMPQELSSNP